MIVEVDVFCSILKRFDTELELNLQIETQIILVRKKNVLKKSKQRELGSYFEPI
jgi:hypothetical protein